MFAFLFAPRRGAIATAFAISVLTSGSVLAATPSDGRPDGGDICLHAAQIAAAKHDVPVSVLTAITLAETGRKRHGNFAPWPWATNVGGAGNWFENRLKAEEFIREQFANGRRNFDVGCFQINYRWHGYQFGSPVRFFDPATSADYAARLLKSLFEEFGDWSKAAGAYHSRTPKFATRYRKRFDKIRNARLHFDENGPVQVAQIGGARSGQIVRKNTFPLLVKGLSPTAGSLFNLPVIKDSRALGIDVSRERLWND